MIFLGTSRLGNCQHKHGYQGIRENKGQAYHRMQVDLEMLQFVRIDFNPGRGPWPPPHFCPRFPRNINGFHPGVGM